MSRKRSNTSKPSLPSPDNVGRRAVAPSVTTGAFEESPTPQLAETGSSGKQPAETKGTINLRIEANTRRLIDDAAATLGKTRTEFMIESARRDAIDVLADQRLFALEPDNHDAFVQALDNPPAPGPKLKALLRRVPAWRQ